MRKISIAIVLLLAACGDAKKSFEKEFKASFEKNFSEGCTTSAMKDGVPEDRKPQVVALCGCVASKLVAKHSMTELAAMGGGGNQELVQAAVEECKPR